MKKNNIIIYLSEFLLLIYIIMFKTIVSKYFVSYISIFNNLFFVILVLIIYNIIGLPKRKSLINYSGIQTLIICFIVYYLLIYIFGLFYGFLSNAYSLKFLNIARNIIGAVIFYILKEVYRYMIAQKARKKNYLPLLIATILITVLDIIMEINSYDLSTSSGIFEFIEASILPKLALSSLLSYISYKFNYKLAILFLLLFDLPKYFLPIFPDMGTYISSMANLIFIFICYYQLSLVIEKYERKIPLTKSAGKKYLLLPIVIPLLILVGLVSGVFKYHLFAIGSNSMLPIFAKGDATLIKKLTEKEYKTIKVGDIIAAYYNNKIIVHRVVSIDEKNGLYTIKTKGDNNDSVDVWTIQNDDIYGKVEHIVKYIGLPSVELGELMNEKW